MTSISSTEPIFRIVEIFNSISGEVNGYNNAGQLSTFIRLWGCNLVCPFCDTPEATAGPSTDMTVTQIVEQINLPHVVITGGEPLCHPKAALEELIGMLNERGHSITIETNGSIEPPYRETHIKLTPRLRYVMDYKPLRCYPPDIPRYMQPYEMLHKNDVIKFVIETAEDYDTLVDILSRINSLPQKWISPIFPSSTPKNEFPWFRKLLQCVIKDSRLGSPLHRYQLGFSIQMHKLLGVK